MIIVYSGKYYRLYELLDGKRKNDSSQQTLTFQQIEDILQFKLPNSAYKYPAWWANETEGSHSHARSWLNAGWKTVDVKIGSSVTFVKTLK